jgi:hypothetical protein
MAGNAADLRVGALAGYAASRVMDHATTFFYGVQSDKSKAREEEIAPGGTLVQVGKQIGQAFGRELDDATAGKVGLALHRTMGITYGVAAAALVKRGVRPLIAGVAVGSAAWVIVDEGTNLPTFTDYPAESHLRGVVGHATYGLAAGLLLALVGDD